MSTLDSDSFPCPNPTASLLLSHRPAPGKVVLVLGTGKLAASRCFACLEAGIKPVVLSITDSNDPDSQAQAQEACPELQHRISSGSVVYHRIDSASFSTQQSIKAQWNQILDLYDAEQDAEPLNAIFAVCITDTLHSGDQTDVVQPSSSHVTNSEGAAPALSIYSRAKLISRLCRKRRIPINVADKPELCDFSFPASYRFPCVSPIVGQATSPTSSSLQVAVTTNGRGCRLAGRIRREIVSALPRNVGDAVDKVGVMRDLAKLRIDAPPSSSSRGTAQVEEEDLSFDTTPLNSPVPQLHPKNPMDQSVVAKLRIKNLQAEIDAEREQRREEAAERTKRRMRWVAQISEYWPIEYLGDLQDQQMQQVLRAYGEDSQANVAKAGDVSSSHIEQHIGTETESRGRAKESSTKSSSHAGAQRARSQHSLDIRPPRPSSSQPRGHIYLLGSGPGHPGLLTTFAYRLLVSPTTDLILSDKLVPSSILKLIPSSTPLEIARKFPGNAEGAQSELIAKALKAALEEGKTVVRLKQGDPFVYGRGGEEVLAFRNAGIECTVVPGISSSIAAPALLGIPVTQRGAADSLVLCTGVGKGGKKVRLPGYERGRTLVVLMGVARLEAVVKTLIGSSASSAGSTGQDDSSMVGDREGPAFPPYTPIAIIERASSSDQRMVASTLDGIVNALEKSGEQRPPGMMVIGWSILSLEGRGDTTIQDDAVECADSESQLAQRDMARVSNWLRGRRFIIKEGLDASYRSALNSFKHFPEHLHHHHEIGHSTDLVPAEEVQQRSETGWAPARYPNGIPEGGWLPGESPNHPAHDSLAYQQNQTYAEVQARLKNSVV